MRKKIALTLATTMCFWAASSAAGQQPITRATSSTSTATIQAIDSTDRTVTLRDASGEEDTYSIGPQVTRFDELKVGDTVKMTYYESLVLQVRKSGQPADTTVNAAKTAGTGGVLPSGTMAVQTRTTVRVKSVDVAVPSITVTTSDGRTITRKVEDAKNLEGVAAGDLVDITYTRALLTSVERTPQ